MFDCLQFHHRLLDNQLAAKRAPSAGQATIAFVYLVTRLFRLRLGMIRVQQINGFCAIGFIAIGNSLSALGILHVGLRTRELPSLHMGH